MGTARAVVTADQREGLFAAAVTPQRCRIWINQAMRAGSEAFRHALV